MKTLLSLTAVALPLSISLSVNAQNLPPVEEFILLAELNPPAIAALPTPPAIAALPSHPAAQTKAKATARLSDLGKPIEPIMALPSTLVSKPAKTWQADPLGDLVNALMMDPLPVDDLLATHPVADLAKPQTADPLGDLVKPLIARPQADLGKPQVPDPFGNLTDGLETTLVLEPVPPASIDPLDDLPKTRAHPAP